MFRSQLSDRPQGSSFVLVLLLLFQPACFIYLVCGCMLSMCVCVSGVPAYVNQTSHRQVHRTHIHIDNIQPHTR
jgi:hypothetical protein